MPSQHGATLWAKKEAKQLARMSKEIVKDALPLIYDKGNNTSSPSIGDRPPVVGDIDIPEALQLGTVMTKISEKKQREVTFRIDPDEGTILYKSSKGGIGMFCIWMCHILHMYLRYSCVVSTYRGYQGT